MDKFQVLEPARLYSTGAARLISSAVSSATGSKAAAKDSSPLVGRLPSSLHLLVLAHIGIPDIPSYARCSRAMSRLARDEKVWSARWAALGANTEGLSEVLDRLERNSKGMPTNPIRATIAVESMDDDFGDFAAVNDDFVGGSSFRTPKSATFGGFGAFSSGPRTPRTFGFTPLEPVDPKGSCRTQYIRAHKLLKPLTRALDAAPHLVLGELGTLSASQADLETSASTLLYQARTLHILSLFLSPSPSPPLVVSSQPTPSPKLPASSSRVVPSSNAQRPIQPIRNWETAHAALRGAIDRFDAGLLTAFETADGRGDEAAMRESATASWEVSIPNSAEATRAAMGDWEMGKVWMEKREIFYEQGKWDSNNNFIPAKTPPPTHILDFDPMHSFITHVLEAMQDHGARAVRVFPPEAQVLLAFGERVANEVVSEYITPLLSRARELSNESYLKATAASFNEAWRMVDTLVAIGAGPTGMADDAATTATSPIGREKSEGRPSIVTKIKAEDVIYQMFEQNMDEYLDEEVESLKEALNSICRDWERQMSIQHSAVAAAGASPTFLGSQNPAQVKRNVLASFTAVLLLPVTIVPRMGAALTTGAIGAGSAAAQGIAMLNPQRWGAAAPPVAAGYSRSGGIDNDTMFEVGEDEDDEDEDEKVVEKPVSITSSHSANASVTTISSITSTAPSSIAKEATKTKLEQLLSLDVALELIHADRESLKRVEIFAGYPGHYGHRVRDTIEEVFILMLAALGDRHIGPGFKQATEQMTSYKPADHEGTTSVAPLLQFFELVHVGDTIQSMVQVYFDKELAPHIDRNDFLNTVVREKKRFENSLDDSVAAGLNAGTDVLMNQVEHIIITMTKPREYYPPDDASMDLGASKGCKEAIKCLDMHCKLLKGSTSKDVLEVFYQEVGIRLIAILQKHIKRQIISLNGGFQIIADLNAYFTFISSLKVTSLTADFAHLKMLGHVYVVEDAIDLAQIVKDVTRYGGAYRPEDIYEFIQRRSDWKKIEKTVDKTMYNLSFKEDCVVC